MPFLARGGILIVFAVHHLACWDAHDPCLFAGESYGAKGSAQFAVDRQR